MREAHTEILTAGALGDTSVFKETRENKGARLRRSVLRLIRLAWITLAEFLKAMARFPLRDRTGLESACAMQAWSSRLTDALGVEVRVRGRRPPMGVLLVSNHRSYIDIAAISRITPCSFVVKSRVRRWPLIGYGADRFCNFVFVDRETANSTKDTQPGIARLLQDGVSMGVFPEGTTHRGPGILPFQFGTFKTAAEGGFPVVPVAIEYEDPEDSWVGEDSLLSHFLRVFQKDRIRVQVSFGPILRSDDPAALRTFAWQWILASTDLCGPPKPSRQESTDQNVGCPDQIEGLLPNWVFPHSRTDPE